MYFLFLRVFQAARPHTPADPAERLSEKPSDFERLTALVAVSWYMVHPANAETINYVIARSDSLSTLFILAAFVAFAYSPVCRKWHLYLVPVALSILAKPVAGIFPILLLVYLFLTGDDVAERGKLKGHEHPEEKDSFISSLPRVRFALSVLAAALPAFLLCAVVLAFVGKMTPASWTPGGPAFFNYAITQPYVILRYFTTFFLPTGLSADTDWRALGTVADPRFISGCLFVTCLLVTAIAASRHRGLRPISFGLLWFLVALIPTSVTPLAEVTNDHRMFFPFVGLAIGVTWMLALVLNRLRKIFRSQRLFRTCVSSIVALGLVAYALGTHQRNEVWKSEESLWRDVTIKCPLNGRGLMNYGLALMEKADYAGAEEYFVKALAILPSYAYLHINLGIVKEAAGKTLEAEEHFLKALSLDARNPECYYYYARFLKNRNRLPEALPILYKALEFAPAHLEARELLMEVHFRRSEFAKVIDIADGTIRIAPDNRPARSYIEEARNRSQLPGPTRTPEEYLELSFRYYRWGLYQLSIEAAREALKLKPDYDPAYNNICSAYNALGMWDGAIEAGLKAIELNPENQLARNNLTWAKAHRH